MKPLLEVKNLTIKLKHKTLFDNFNLAIDNGEKIALVGNSGSGKSTFAKSILNILDKGVEIVNGEIIFNGENVLKMDKKRLKKLRGNEIGYIFQSSLSALNPVEKIKNQAKITYFSHFLDKNKEKLNKKMESILFDLGFQKNEIYRILNSYPDELSGGQAARVYVMLILLLEPQLIIADESFVEIDNINKNILLNSFEKLNKQGKAIILISHNDFLVKKFTDKIICFS